MGRGPQEQVSKAAWDGSTLVITTVHTFPSLSVRAHGARAVAERYAMTSETRTSCRWRVAGVARRRDDT